MVAPVIPANSYKFSLGKQAALGTPVANPDYQIPVWDADIGPTQNLIDIAVIEGQAFLPGKLKSQAWFEGDVTWVSHPDSTPRILAAHLGTNSDTMTGAGDPRTHTFARKDADSGHTMWVGRPVSGGTFEYDKGVDCIVSKLDFIYNSGDLFKLGTHIIGMSTLGVATAPTPTNTILIPSAGNFGHTWARAVLKLDLNATPAVTTVTNIQSFTVTSEYANMTPIFTQNLNPDYYQRGLWSLSFDATFLVANWQAYNWTFYGSTAPGANTAQSSSLGSGAVSFLIDQEPANANRTLQILIPYCQMTVSRPTPNADGSGLTVTLHGDLSQPPSGEPISVVDLTAVSTNYS